VPEVVGDQQPVFGGQKAFRGLVGRLAREHDDPERLDDRRGKALGSVQRGERDEVRSVGEARLDRARGLQGEPCLADPAGPGEGEQPHRAESQPLADRAQLVLATDRPVRRRRQGAIGAGGISTRHGGEDQRREICRQIADVDLQEVFWPIEVLQPPLSPGP
jgi:hypothetical protein